MFLPVDGLVTPVSSHATMYIHLLVIRGGGSTDDAPVILGSNGGMGENEPPW